MEVQYWIDSHAHPLGLRQDAGNEQLRCKICKSRIESCIPFYTCHSCNAFYAHKSCAHLPHQIHHPFHPHSPLTFLGFKSTLCHSCRKHKFAQFYSCRSCYDFNVDVKCALMPLAVSSDSIEGRDWIRHFGHMHPLFLCVDPTIECFGCNSTNSGGDHQPLYGCSKCHYFLHKSCAQLPQKIYLPFHHQVHRDEFVLLIRSQFRCGRCNTIMEDRFNFCFHCKTCSLWICFKCTGITSSRKIDYEDHQHPLHLMENVNDSGSFLSQCNGDYSYCAQCIVMSSDEFKKIDFLLWCFYCDFKVHLLCAPLPSIIKHEFHTHSLVLVDSLAEDDSGEYYCDVCETKRDPRIRLYCCRDCKYFAHLHCVIPEVLKVLLEDRSDVELKSVGHDIWNVPGCELTVDRVGPANMTLKDVIDQLPEYEKYTLRQNYKWNETSPRDEEGKREDGIEISNSFTVSDEEIDEILHLSYFSDESFLSFWSSLEDYFHGNEVELKSSDLAMEIVKVKGYMIPDSLAAVLNKLLSEFGDIVNASNWSIGFRSFVLFVICKVVKRMRITMPECITKNLLQEWYHHLRFAYYLGFKVEFAQEQLKKLVHPFLGFQAKRLEHEIPTILTQRIAELQQKSKALQLKLDECNKICGSSSKSEYQKYCFNMASELKWKVQAIGDRSDVELRSVGHDIWNVPGYELIVDRVGSANMTLKDVIDQLSEYEKDILRRYYKWDETSSQDQKGKQEDRSNSLYVRDEEFYEFRQLFHLSDESFQSFWSSLYNYFRRNKVELKSSDLSLKIVKVKGYMIPHSLAAVLNRLLREFGDIASGSDESIGFKSFKLFLICKVVERMRFAIPQCITKNLLQEWYFHLTFATNRSFRIEFARQRLKKLVHAFLGFQAERLKQKGIATTAHR